MSLLFHQHTLPNGLTILAEANSAAHTSAVGFFVKTGARDEDRGLMGVSHFLEHMLFKGTASRTAEDVNREFDDMGANYNAFTSEELTVYYAQVLPEFLHQAVGLLGDILRPALRPGDFDMEKNVILEEIGMYDDRPQSRLNDVLLETYFREHPLGHRVLGTNDSVGAIRLEQMKTYFHDRYGPENITVAAAGSLDFDQLVDDLGAVAGSWVPAGAARNGAVPQIEDHDVNLSDPRVNRHYLAVMCPGPAAEDPRRYAGRILADVLGDADGSRLYWALVDPGLAEDAGFSMHPQDGIGSFLGSAICDPEDARKVETTLLETIDRYEQDIDEGEIERAKNKLATHATLQGESPAGRMQALGAQWVYLREYVPLAEELARLMAVTSQDVRTLLNEMPLHPRTIVRLGPP